MHVRFQPRRESIAAENKAVATSFLCKRRHMGNVLLHGIRHGLHFIGRGDEEVAETDILQM
jgi:hypothetical protein